MPYQVVYYPIKEYTDDSDGGKLMWSKIFSTVGVHLDLQHLSVHSVSPCILWVDTVSSWIESG